MDTVVENLFSGSVHIYSFAKETPSCMEELLDPGFECENGERPQQGFECESGERPQQDWHRKANEKLG